MPQQRPRLFVLTDISSEEPDDLQSLIRLLLYSNEIEIEGLIATLSEWKSLLGSPFGPDLIHRALDAYACVRPQLLKHDHRYPEADALRQTVAVGNGNDLAATGPGKESPGAWPRRSCETTTSLSRATASRPGTSTTPSAAGATPTRMTSPRVWTGAPSSRMWPSTPPIAVVDGDRSNQILNRQLKPGGELTLDASASTYPAGRPLHYHWWLYAEAGDGNGLRLEAKDSSIVLVRLRADSNAAGCHHLILELTNEGEPPLKAYRRILIADECIPLPSDNHG